MRQEGVRLECVSARGAFDSRDLHACLAPERPNLCPSNAQNLDKCNTRLTAALALQSADDSSGTVDDLKVALHQANNENMELKTRLEAALAVCAAVYGRTSTSCWHAPKCAN